MKIVFFGSSDFSIPALEFCCDVSRELVGVVTTPDQPKGRGLLIQSNPVKEFCDRLGLCVLSPASLADPELQQKLSALNPDLFIVASYGKLIPTPWLKIPKVASWNVHPSLVPKYRGAAPIPWQILSGEKETGVSILLVTPQLDAGDILHQIRTPLDSEATSQSLMEQLSRLSRKALEETYAKLKEGKLQPIAQKENEASYARKLTKEDGLLNLNEDALELSRKIRAFLPWPGAFIGLENTPVRILETKLDSVACAEAKRGTLLEINPLGYFRLQTGKGSLKIFKVQLPGRKAVTGADFVNGQRMKPGFIFRSLK